MLEGARGAFVLTLALAFDVNDFHRKVTAKLASYDLSVVDIVDIERCRTRFERCSVAEDVKMIAESLCSESPVRLHTFHLYASGE